MDGVLSNHCQKKIFQVTTDIKSSCLGYRNSHFDFAFTIIFDFNQGLTLMKFRLLEYSIEIHKTKLRSQLIVNWFFKSYNSFIFMNKVIQDKFQLKDFQNNFPNLFRTEWLPQVVKNVSLLNIKYLINNWWLINKKYLPKNFPQTHDFIPQEFSPENNKNSVPCDYHSNNIFVRKCTIKQSTSKRLSSFY